MIGGRKKTRGREDRTSAFKETEGCPQEVKQGPRVCMALITSLGEAGEMPRQPKAACLFLRRICYKVFVFFFFLPITASTSFLYQRSRHIMPIFIPLQSSVYKDRVPFKNEILCLHVHTLAQHLQSDT